MTTAPGQVRGFLLFAVLTVASSVHADFSGPYAVTPPSPGRYGNSGLALPYGNWSAFVLNGVVDTSEAPLRLQLENPSHSFDPDSLRFETHAAASGMVSFDCATVSIFSPNGYFIRWLWQPDGGNRLYVPLDQGPNGQLRHFDFRVQAGDVFGFILISGGDVISPGEPLLNTLTVENFIAPIPEVNTSAMIMVGCLLFGVQPWRRKSASLSG